MSYASTTSALRRRSARWWSGIAAPPRRREGCDHDSGRATVAEHHRIDRASVRPSSTSTSCRTPAHGTERVPSPGAAESPRCRRLAGHRSVPAERRRSGCWTSSRYAEAHEEIGRGCSSVRSLLTVHSMLACAPATLGHPGTDGAVRPGLASGSVLGRLLSCPRPGAGSDTEGITIDRHGDARRRVDSRRRGRSGSPTGSGPTSSGLRPQRGRPGSRCWCPATARSHGRTAARRSGTRASMLAQITFDDVRLGAEATLGPRAFTSGLVLTSTWIWAGSASLWFGRHRPSLPRRMRRLHHGTHGRRTSRFVTCR